MTDYPHPQDAQASEAVLRDLIDCLLAEGFFASAECRLLAPEELTALRRDAALPPLPAEPFSTREVAALLGCGTVLAQRTLYCLRALGLVEHAGKRGRTPLHALATPAPPAPA